MALSSALREVLREFTATAQGGKSEEAKADLSKLEEMSQGGLADSEDCAFGIVAKLYDAEMPESGKGSDSLGVDKE